MHAATSARRFGGKPDDYLKVHEWFDQTKAHHGSVKHRAVLHHAFGVFLAEQVFGKTLTNSDGDEVNVQDVAEQHVLDDLKRIPTIDEWLREMPARPWMAGGPGAPGEAAGGDDPSPAGGFRCRLLVRLVDVDEPASDSDADPTADGDAWVGEFTREFTSAVTPAGGWLIDFDHARGDDVPDRRRAMAATSAQVDRVIYVPASNHFVLIGTDFPVSAVADDVDDAIKVMRDHGWTYMDLDDAEDEDDSGTQEPS